MKNDNVEILARWRGVPAQAATPESEADQTNPNRLLPVLRCEDCDNGIEPNWKFCAWCGSVAQEDI